MTDTPETNAAETEAAGTNAVETDVVETSAVETNAAETDAKRKFQEALERKSRNARSQQAHHEARLKINGASGLNRQHRNFRRKAG
ncbi:hypothetical protein EDD93_7739 [Streptomyces sp. 840.1]|uniref:DUF5302 domain-containing protein n=1 Tax=Streptomyces sp. 840.1 TaxID=2485152 RepID=UPI000F46D8EE|nr:DUF5302 domain-containing protein [Streptomyces sp. 840.1]ROQ57407.1 hypothetical protein EDD93_7739 [Streptomyces sp. 840.1]